MVMCVKEVCCSVSTAVYHVILAISSWSLVYRYFDGSGLFIEVIDRKPRSSGLFIDEGGG